MRKIQGRNIFDFEFSLRTGRKGGVILTRTFAGTISRTVSNFVNNLASPTGFEPVLSA
jgi:hypothetical protein